MDEMMDRIRALEEERDAAVKRAERKNTTWQEHYLWLNDQLASLRSQLSESQAREGRMAEAVKAWHPDAELAARIAAFETLPPDGNTVLGSPVPEKDNRA